MNEADYQHIVDAMEDSLTVLDADGTILFANSKAAYNLSGCAPSAIIGGNIPQFVTKAQAKNLLKQYRCVITTGQPLEQEVMVTLQGIDRWFMNTLKPVSFGVHNIPALVSNSRDITDRKRVEDKLRESEDKFRSIFEEAIDGIMIADVETKMQIEANKAICGMLGYAHDEIVGLSIDDIHPKEDLPTIRDLFEKQLRDEICRAPEVPMLRKDGSIFYADINATPVTLGGKQYLVGIFRDITERKQAEMVLKTREKQLAESQRIAHIGSWEHNLGTGGVFWSDEMFHLLGLDPKKDPADFNLFFEMIHSDDRPALKKAIDVTLQQHIPYSIDYRFVLRDGTIRIIHAQAELIPDESGNLMILSGTAQDITDRKETEDRIHQNEKFIRSILDSVDEGFLVIDRDYRILTANKAYCSQVSLPCDNVIGRHCYEISHKTVRPCYEKGEECAVRKVFATGEPHALLDKHSDHEGHVLYVEKKSFPIKDAAGNITSVIEMINNITERHLLEEERLKTQKLESIGTLAGGIAHDFNNLLQGIFGYISMAKLTFDQKEKSLAMLEQAEKALHQSVNLTTQLLTFSKGGKPAKKRISLGPVIEDSARFTLSGSRSDFRLNIPEDLWQTEADEGQLGQVIQNIVLNADQAMPIGGTVKVTAANMVEGDASLPPGLAKGGYVVITIRDTGIGIPEQYLSKIFDPYFTTKEKGSGLGLATAYSIIRNHGGILDVRTKSGEGSTFMIYLPAIAGEGRIESAVRPQELSLPRRARILVMDDEEILRNLSSELLGELGHDVEVAKHGQETLEKYQGAVAAGSPFDIVILDLTVRGGMGGAETMQKLLGIDPAVKAIISSGYSDDAATANYEKLGFKAFLKKPYDVDALREVLNKMLNS
jgi:two-component system cell cycle sensor histidine kinase/response regulator CckA